MLWLANQRAPDQLLTQLLFGERRWCQTWVRRGWRVHSSSAFVSAVMLCFPADPPAQGLTEECGDKRRARGRLVAGRPWTFRLGDLTTCTSSSLCHFEIHKAVDFIIYCPRVPVLLNMSFKQKQCLFKVTGHLFDFLIRKKPFVFSISILYCWILSEWQWSQDTPIIYVFLQSLV